MQIYISLPPPPPIFRVSTPRYIQYNLFLRNKMSHTMRTERATRFCARYRGGKELFRIKVPSLPYDPSHLQKNRLGALPLKTLIRGGDFKGVAGSKTGFESYNSVFCRLQVCETQTCIKNVLGFLGVYP